MVGLAALWASLAGAYLLLDFFHPILLGIYVAFAALIALPAAFTSPRDFRIAGGVVAGLLVPACLLTVLVSGMLFLPALFPLVLALLPLRGLMPAVALASISALIALGAYFPLLDLVRAPSCFEVTMPEGSWDLARLEGTGSGIGSGAEGVSTLGLTAGYLVSVQHSDDLSAAGRDALGQRLRVVFPEATKVRPCQPRLTFPGR